MNSGKKQPVRAQSAAARRVPKDAFLKPYMRLRTLLDGLEATALRYCLADKKAGQRIKREKELKELLMPVIEKINVLSGKGPVASGGCGDGYNNCGGVCVPWICPEGTVDS